MPLTSVNLLAGFNRDDSPAWSVQDVCNFLPVVADQPGTTTQFKLRTPPGLKPYQRIGKGPIRGAHNAEGRLFVVSSQTLYEVSAKGIGIPRGTVPGVGRVRMAHNQIKNGNQIAIANGQSGYIYNTVTQVFTRITDEGFPGAVDVVFINGYLFWIEPFGRYWLHCDLADGLSYNTLDRGEAESQPDRIVGVAVSQGDVLLFGERTTEFYRNTGQATGTFQSTGTTIDVGCASLHTIQNLDNSVMWLGNDGVIYRLDGLRALPISTRAIEKAIAKYDWANAFAFTWEDEGHKVYYITFPGGETFGYDVVVGLWHRRESFGFSRWRPSTAVAWGRKWIGGDFQDGRLWLLDWDYVLEGSDELIATYTTAEVSDSGNRIGIPEMELLFDVGHKATEVVDFPIQPEGPSISGAAPDGVSGIPWGPYSYSASGGTGLLRFRVQPGALPPGLSLNVEGVLSGTPIAPGISAGETVNYNFSIYVVDSNGLWAELNDSIQISAAELACGAAFDFDGGQSFPGSHLVQLGSDTGLVTLKYATAGNPDKFEVWVEGVKVIDTGYHGDASFQPQLSAYLAANGLPPETITQRPGGDYTPANQWNNCNFETATFTKTTSNPVAEVRVFAPLDGTAWRFSLDCPT